MCRGLRKVTMLRLAPLLLVFLAQHSIASGFDVRRHLSTKTRYEHREPLPGAPPLASTPDPKGYQPLHLWLLSRHGTRWPTPERMHQINRLEQLFADATATKAHPWIKHWHSPFAGPDSGMASGELHAIGEYELWSLARRLRARLAPLASERYLPKRYSLVSSQESRAAASASAFASGFFPPEPASPLYSSSGGGDPRHQRDASGTATTVYASTDGNEDVEASAALQGAGTAPPARRPLAAPREGPGVLSIDADRSASSSSSSSSSASPSSSAPPSASLSFSSSFFSSSSSAASSSSSAPSSSSSSPWAASARPQAVALTMSPLRSDPLLRFFDTCPNYSAQVNANADRLEEWCEERWSQLAPALEQRLGLTRPMHAREVEALWQLCAAEAGLAGDATKSCTLFTPSDVALLEWVDDTLLDENHGYGADINFRSASVLMADLHGTLKNVSLEERPFQRARLLFAHEETLIPLVALMGLFKEHEREQSRAEHVVAEAWQQPQRQGQPWVSAARRALRAQQRTPAGGRAALGPEAREAGALEALPAPDEGAAPDGWSPRIPSGEDRVWRGARIGSYGSNLAVVLYRSSKKEKKGRPRHLVRLVYNEHIIPVPGCSTVGSTVAGDALGHHKGPSSLLDCDLEFFLKQYAEVADSGIMARECGLQQAGNSNAV